MGSRSPGDLSERPAHARCPAQCSFLVRKRQAHLLALCAPVSSVLTDVDLPRPVLVMACGCAAPVSAQDTSRGSRRPSQSLQNQSRGERCFWAPALLLGGSTLTSASPGLLRGLPGALLSSLSGSGASAELPLILQDLDRPPSQLLQAQACDVPRKPQPAGGHPGTGHSEPRLPRPAVLLESLQEDSCCWAGPHPWPCVPWCLQEGTARSQASPEASSPP